MAHVCLCTRGTIASALNVEHVHQHSLAQTHHTQSTVRDREITDCIIVWKIIQISVIWLNVKPEALKLPHSSEEKPFSRRKTVWWTEWGDGNL